MVKVALIGCGTMGRTHATAYQKMEHVQVVAMCDLQADKAEALAAPLGAKVFTDFESMMAEGGFEMVDVCLPTYLHKDYSIAAMRAGKHVFCEKPIARSVEEAQEMVRVAHECNVKFSVGHVLRFFPAYKNAIEQLEQGKLGIPRLIRTVRNQAFPAWSWEGWYQDTEKSGGPILDLVIHDIDWIIHNFGKVDRVFAKALNGSVENQDHCLVVLHLENGAIAHVEGSWAFPKGSAFNMAFEIVGTDGQLEYDNILNASVIKQTVVDDHHNIAYLSPTQGTKEPYCIEIMEFIKCIEDGTEPVVTGEQAVLALRVALAALESSHTGLPVELS